MYILNNENNKCTEITNNISAKKKENGQNWYLVLIMA